MRAFDWCINCHIWMKKIFIKGNVGEICKNTVHPNLFPELDDLNTVVCEQTNFDEFRIIAHGT
jgi:hypothetical protein